MTMRVLTMRAALIAAAAASLGACASQQVGGGYEAPRYAVGEPSHVEYGTVQDAYPITIQGSRTGVGAVTGAVAGGVAGSSIGGGDRAHILGGIAGAVVGGIVGDAVEEGVTRQKGIEYIIRLDSGDIQKIDQGATYDIRRGDRVQIIYDSRRHARVVPARPY